MRARCSSHRSSRDLVIGLVNGMPPGAMQATEEQFNALIGLPPQGWSLRLRYFVAPSVRAQAMTGLGGYYEDIDALWDSDVDGLIVTGAEPKAAAMADEPYWPWLARLVDWAADNTISAVWSCMAAHAAVYRLDGLARYSMPEKLSGVFECRRAADHFLVSNAPPRWSVPHSRHNSLDEIALREHDYLVLSSGPRVGADMFVKRVLGSLFLMLQGHPEYYPDSLLREYRRDIKQFLAGRRDKYPAMPKNYFNQDTTAMFTDLRRQICMGPSRVQLPPVEAGGQLETTHSWRPQAVRLYTRWLSYLAAQKSEHFEMSVQRMEHGTAAP